MNINLDNYESIFLLYVDKELDAAERQLVEAFIDEHPYLAAELQILGGLVLREEEKVFLDKNILYRSANIEENMQEAMLLHIDDELPENSKQELLKKLDTDKDLQDNWRLLQKTKLNAAEIIPFKNKKILYRTEGSRIVVGRFAKWAVAAALLAAGFFTAISLLKQEPVSGVEFTKAGNDIKNPDTIATGSVKEALAVTEKNIDSPKLLPAQATQSTQKVTNGYAEAKVPQRTKEDFATTSLKEGVLTKTPLMTKQKQVPISQSNDPENVIAANKDIININRNNANDLGLNTASLTASPRPSKEIIDFNIAETKQPFAKTASIVEEEEENDNRILGMDADKVSRTKTGIFFKKLKRTVARSANIKTGNSLKIAGFEFAVK
ncbi:MAG: hypothetical protein H7X88_05030 [Gloeobacteraceae cyanobacterium ES-bin-316]|nr:hypothetical protein [Ferruginibacter sp.]